MTSMMPNFIFISGGMSLNGEILKVVERYDSIKDRWVSLPDLNEARI